MTMTIAEILSDLTCLVACLHALFVTLTAGSGFVSLVEFTHATT
jgi:hypothetical protein